MENKDQKPWYKKWWVIALIVIATIFIIAALVPTPETKEEKTTQQTKESSPAAKQKTQEKVNETQEPSYSIPNVEGYDKKKAAGSSDALEIYIYTPKTTSLKQALKNIYVSVRTSKDAKASVLAEKESYPKDWQSVALNGADGAYTGCTEEFKSGTLVTTYDYESCHTSFYKGGLVVVVEANIATDKIESGSKNIAEKMLLESKKIAEAILQP